MPLIVDIDDLLLVNYSGQAMMKHQQFELRRRDGATHTSYREDSNFSGGRQSPRGVAAERRICVLQLLGRAVWYLSLQSHQRSGNSETER